MAVDAPAKGQYFRSLGGSATAVDVGLAASLALESAVPVRAGVDVLRVVLVRLGAADGTLPPLGLTTALRTAHGASSIR